MTVVDPLTVLREALTAHIRPDFPAPAWDALAAVEQLVEAARDVTLLIFESDEDEVRAAERFRAALARFEGGSQQGTAA